ncbi:hypothetical protein G9C85_13840 [Halorubellus sp. JP-L1]|uniref:hypothetical protein n=1 Tax=Halorubellus sp. JP-L1 TaxID=2715753 RepID=UPI00140BDCB0|nr:hypothetical protein [Halorubellus sp. JP-L1]NHN42703.1 hypothetical protein [Halorubellus sp. JP-L1]
MANVPSVKDVESTDEFVHVRFRDPDDFETIRTPDWAENAASSVVEGSEVRMGDEKGNEDWVVQSVLVPNDVDEDEATSKAEEIVEKIES